MARPKKDASNSTTPPATKKVKKVKDPNAPKRALSAYFLWLGENRHRFQKKGASVAETTKAAAAEWNGLADKSEWEKKAAEEKKRYAKDLAAYNKKKENAEEDE